MAFQAIRVEGLRDFQRDLRRIRQDLPKELRKVNLDVAKAAQSAVKAGYTARGGVAAKVAPSVRAGATQRGAYIKAGGAKYPFFYGAEFGGGRYRKGRPTPRGGYTSQFPPHRGRTGYVLYPTLRRSRRDLERRLWNGLDRLTRQAFPR